MEVLNLSQNVVKVLATDLDSFSSDQLVKVCRLFLQKLVLGDDVGGKLDEKCNCILEAIGSVFLDAARTKTTEPQLRYVVMNANRSSFLL